MRIHSVEYKGNFIVSKEQNLDIRSQINLNKKNKNKSQIKKNHTI